VAELRLEEIVSPGHDLVESLIFEYNQRDATGTASRWLFRPAVIAASWGGRERAAVSL